MTDAYHFNAEPVIGRRVSGRTEGHHVGSGAPYNATWSGIYLGVVRSDHDGEPMHLFADGEINGIRQSCHGFPAVGRSVTRPEGSTYVVREWETHKAEDEVSLFYVTGADGATYPADDYLRDMAGDGCPLITDEAEALETARSALIQSEGWPVAYVYRRDPGGMHSQVAVLTPPGAPTPPEDPSNVRTILVHLNVSVPVGDHRDAGQIAAVLMDALTVGLEGAEDCGVDAPDATAVVMALAEDV